MTKITIAGVYPDEAYELLKKGLAESFEISYIKDQATLDASTDLEYVLLRTLKMSRSNIENNAHLKMIQRWGAGYDTVDVEAASEANIPVTVAKGVNSCAVAEHAILLMLALYRHILPLDRKLRKGVWDRTTFVSESYTINGKKAGLIGCGAIGKMVASKLQALGATIQYYDLFRMSASEEQELHISFVDFKTLLTTSDIISIHLPLTSDTVDLISEKELALLKKNAILVNTSRGGIINESDLADALQLGHLLGAALDSYEVEPYPKNGRLASIENVVMTPHIGGSVADLVIPMAEKVLGNIHKVLESKPLNKSEYVNFSDCSFPSE